MSSQRIGQLLSKLMDWDRSDVARERPILESIAALKYDGYQPFFPGFRFIESLAVWLNQFNIDERKKIYSFVREYLIYISDDEMQHLVTMAYPDCIKQILIKIVAAELDIPGWNIKKIVNSLNFRIALRKSMFLGLSDGAHIGLFRRSNNPDISHEQILRSHEIPRDRALKMKEELEKDLRKITLNGNVKPMFNNVFLLDDFSASGHSYLRKKDSEFAGKIYNFYNIACKTDGRIYHLFDPKKMNVCLVLYVATEEAINYISEIGNEIFGNIPFKVKTTQLLPDHIRINNNSDQDLLDILRKYYDPSIENPSYKTGRHDSPYLGYNECGLPLILYHNTPNNSLPLLWYGKNRKYRGLFPRIERHSE